MAKAPAQKKPNGNDSGLNFEAQLWAAADKMRGHMDAYGLDKSVRGQRRLGLPHEARRVSTRRRANQSNYTTWKLARMNLAIRGIDANLGPRNADSFRQDLHPDLKADFILANPPFNVGDWGGENLRQDARWKFGLPPVNNANYAWIQHFIHHLSPVGVAGFVMANGSISTQSSGEGETRKALIEADLANAITNI